MNDQPTDPLAPLGPAFVWSRFGTEAGESFDDILSRKEAERAANGGVFYWGIGNSVGAAIDLLRRQGNPQVVFSPIAGRARSVDVFPTSTVRWTRAEDWLGFEVKLPSHTVVTSRGDRACHYALVCFCPTALSADGTEILHFDSLSNLASGHPLGASQTTAVVQRRGGIQTGRAYRMALWTVLVPPYFVRLTCPETIISQPCPGVPADLCAASGMVQAELPLTTLLPC